ncbi:hypothetical protein H0H92_010290, partial [Tricholoma furcatifolium]
MSYSAMSTPSRQSFGTPTVRLSDENAGIVTARTRTPFNRFGTPLVDRANADKRFEAIMERVKSLE